MKLKTYRGDGLGLAETRRKLPPQHFAGRDGNGERMSPNEISRFEPLNPDLGKPVIIPDGIGSLLARRFVRHPTINPRVPFSNAQATALPPPREESSGGRVGERGGTVRSLPASAPEYTHPSIEAQSYYKDSAPNGVANPAKAASFPLRRLCSNHGISARASMDGDAVDVFFRVFNPLTWLPVRT